MTQSIDFVMVIVGGHSGLSLNCILSIVCLNASKLLAIFGFDKDFDQTSYHFFVNILASLKTS